MAPTPQAKAGQYLNLGDNQDLLQYFTIGGGLSCSINSNGIAQTPPSLVSANGAINPHVGEIYMITKAGVCALTLAAPTIGADDGTSIVIISNTAFAHTVTATGLLNNGTTGGPHNLATYAAFPGAAISLYAYNGLWNIEYAQNVVIT